jgi:hypothetical protein
VAFNDSQALKRWHSSSSWLVLTSLVLLGVAIFGAIAYIVTPTLLGFLPPIGSSPIPPIVETTVPNVATHTAEPATSVATSTPVREPTIAPTPTSIATVTPLNLIETQVIENGYAYWVNASQPPRQEYSVRGRMEITAYPGFVKITSRDAVFYVPWERIVYIGSEEIR